MEFQNQFNVDVPPEEAWTILTDIERIAPCMPGAAVTEVIDENTFKGTVSVRLGPVALTFAGEASFEDRDDAGHSARVKAQGRDAKGRGGANADVRFRLVPAEGSATTVEIQTDLQLSGSVAQYGRGVGMIKDVATQLINQFAAALHQQITADQQAAAEAEGAEEAAAPAAEPPAPPAAKPISGVGLGLTVTWNAFVRGLKRLLGIRSEG